MIKLLYQKNNGKVITQLAKRENVISYYNTKLYDTVEVEEIPLVSKNQYLVYENGVLVVKNDYNKTISELKSKLSATDYKAIKYAEGLLSEYEFAPIREQRQAWRDEINYLEQLLLY